MSHSLSPDGGRGGASSPGDCITASKSIRVNPGSGVNRPSSNGCASTFVASDRDSSRPALSRSMVRNGNPPSLTNSRNQTGASALVEASPAMRAKRAALPRPFPMQSSLLPSSSFSLAR